MRPVLIIYVPEEKTPQVMLAIANICQYATEQLKDFGWPVRLTHTYLPEPETPPPAAPRPVQ